MAHRRTHSRRPYPAPLRSIVHLCSLALALALVLAACTEAEETQSSTEAPAGGVVVALEAIPRVAAPGAEVTVALRAEANPGPGTLAIGAQTMAVTWAAADGRFMTQVPLTAPNAGDHLLTFRSADGTSMGHAFLQVSSAANCEATEDFVGGECVAANDQHTIQLDRFMHWGFMYWEAGELRTDRDMSHPRTMVPFGETLVGCFSEAVGVTWLDDLAPAADFGDRWELAPPVSEALIEVHGMATCNDIAVSEDRRFAVTSSRGDDLSGGLMTWSLPPLEASRTQPPQLIAAYPHAQGFEAGAFMGNHFITTQKPNRVGVYELTAGGELELLKTETIDAMTTGWGVRVDGDRFYVTDAGSAHPHQDGSIHHHDGGALFIMALAPDGAPKVLGTAETSGAARDVAILPDGVVAVAAGPAGVELFDVTDPTTPSRLVTAPTTGTVMSVSYSRGLLLAATWNGAQLFDAASRGRLRPWDTTDGLESAVGGLEGFLAHAITRDIRVGYHVQLYDDRVVVAEIDRLFAGRVNRGGSGPRLNLLDRKLTVNSAAPVIRALRLGNGGRTTLKVDVAADYQVQSMDGPLLLAPGELGVLEVAIEGVTEDRWLTLETNDAAGPTRRVSLLALTDGYGEGDVSPDFSLPVVTNDCANDAECRQPGQCYELKEELKRGRPVVLAFFSSW